MPTPEPDRQRADDLLHDPLLRDAPVVEGFKVLDPAVLYAKIGKGGMGAVYRGRHFKLDLDVAVKCLKPSLVAEDQDFVKRFEREARLAASIAHQNVVRVMDVQEKNGLHYLVMEFVRGETADERVRRKGPLAEKEALAILLGATAGLAEAHARGIVHRDIKPSNILVSLEGRVKLADLGLAKASGAVDGRSMSMATSMILGTPQYMPPEQWESTDVTPAADVWALGATLYFLLAGREGIRGGSPMQVADRIRGQDYPTLRAERADVRTEVHDLLERCVRRDPKDRFPDARALLKALRKLAVDDEEVLLDPETGSGIARVATVTPPPRETLLKIRAQIETNPTGKGLEDVAATKVTPPHAVATGRAGLPPLAVPSRRGPRIAAVAAVLLVAGLGTAWAMGAFAPAQNAAAKGDPASPPVVGNGGERDPKGEAKAAFARAMVALPKSDQLDVAITEFEQALALDPTLAEARVHLARAFGSKAKKAAATDPDAAYVLVRRGLEHQPGDAALMAQGAELERVLGPRLGQGLAIQQPKPLAVLGSRTVAVSGRADAPLLKALRLAVVAAPDGPVAFPADAAIVPVVGGEFTAEVAVPGDGTWQIVLEGEDDHGLRATPEPVRIVVDTEAPQFLIAAPGAGVTVAAATEVRGRILDTTACTVTVNGASADTSTPGEWTAKVTLDEGPQELVVTATDAGGHSSTVRQRVRVDATPPEIQVTPLPVLTKEAEVSIGGTVHGLDGGRLTLGLLPVEVAADGLFAAKVALAKDDAYTFVLTAVDGVGNKAVQQVAVRRDSTPPVLGWSSPDPGQAVAAGAVEVAGTVEDESAVVVTVNGQPAAVDSGRWRARVQAAAPAPAPAPGSTLQALARVVVVATDAAGNRSAEMLRLLKVVPAFGARFESGIGLAMVFVKPGTFLMGSPPSETGRSEDEPQHTVTISKGYWIGETEVTQKQWRDVMGTEPWKGKPNTIESDEAPAVCVSWNDAVAFCDRLTERARAASKLPEGYRYQLPTEAEWEMACRGGATAAYCFGDDELRLSEFAVFRQARIGDHAHAVRMRKANGFGLYDMHGNVWEWCADTADYLHSRQEVLTESYVSSVMDPQASTGGLRVHRGGSFVDEAVGCRSANRDCSNPTHALSNLGMRVVLATRMLR